MYVSFFVIPLIQYFKMNALFQGSTVTRQRSRYYTPGKGLPNVRCYNCNEKGHLSQYCPEPKVLIIIDNLCVEDIV